MNRSIWIVIVSATLLTGGLYSLPKVVVSTQERKLIGGKDSTSTTTSEEESATSSPLIPIQLL
ncbi:MAG: hypothetical protein R2822_13720 [Spirosomataceae bacterium]